jgi:hypothetical protein
VTDESTPEEDGPREATRPPTGELVVRGVPVPAAGRWSRGVAALRTRLPELVRDPAVLATATVSAGVAAGVTRQALKSRALRRSGAPAPVVIGIYVVERVHVVHHVVHHVVRPALPAAAPRPPRPS